MNPLRTALELALIVAIWAAASVLTAVAHIPLPGPVLGLLALLAAFATGWVKPGWFNQGANLLLSHLLLFFIPPMLVLWADPALMGWLGLKLLLAVVTGTLAVMSVTGLLALWLIRHDD